MSSVRRLVDLAAIDDERGKLLSRLASITTNPACSAEEKRAVVADTINAIRQIGELNGIFGAGSL